MYAMNSPGSNQADSVEFLDRLARKLDDISIDEAEREASTEPLELSRHSPVPPQIRWLGDYELVDRLGEGGMGTVYVARQRSLPGKFVAIKVLPPYFAFDPKRVARFRIEADAASRINHPSIVSVHHVGEDNGVHYIVQELVPGGRTLAHHIRDSRDAKSLPKDYYRRTAEFFAKVAQGLHAIHVLRIIHRDIKPSNILTTAQDEPKIADFGLAKDLEVAGGLQSSDSLGTPNYKSPEQIDRRLGPVDASSDIFALGATLYESLTLVRLFDGDTEAEIYRKIQELAVPDPRSARSGIPRELALICLKCLERIPARRYASAIALADDLQCYLTNHPIRARAPSKWRRGVLLVKRRPLVSISLAAIAALMAAFSALFVVTAGRTVERHDAALRQQSAAVQAALGDASRSRLLGDWELVLLYVAQARELGATDVAELDLREAEAWLASGQVERAAAALNHVPLTALSDRQQLRLNLLRFQADPTADATSVATQFTIVSSILDVTPTDADVEFAQALLSDTTAEALAHLDAARQLDPHNHGVLTTRIALLLLLGRHNEALTDAKFFGRMYPQDPAFASAEALELCVNDQAERAQSAIAEIEAQLGSAGESGLRDMCQFVESFNEVPTSFFWDGSGSTEFRNAFEPGRRILQRFVKGPAKVDAVLVPRLKSVRMVFDMLERLTTAEPTSEESARALSDVLAVHDEGTLWFFHGIALLGTELQGNETQFDKLRRCLPSFEKAMHTPCVIPRIWYIARYMAGRCYNDLVFHAHDEVVKSRCIRECREFVVDEQTQWDDVLLFANLAHVCGETETALVMITRWRYLHPDDQHANVSCVQVLRLMGALDLALVEVNTLVQKHPDNAKAVAEREAVLKAMRDAYPRPEK